MADADGLFDREQVERAHRYHRPLYLAAAAALAVELALLGLLSFSVVGERLYASTGGWPWSARALGFSLLVLALTRAIGLPLAFWSGYLHEHAWECAGMTPERATTLLLVEQPARLGSTAHRRHPDERT